MHHVNKPGSSITLKGQCCMSYVIKHVHFSDVC